MSVVRKVQVTLTEAQYDALADAVARGQYDIECEMDDDPERGARKQRWKAGERAWEKLSRAWYAAGRS